MHTPGKWAYNIKMDLKVIKLGWYRLDLSGLGSGPVGGSCEHKSDPSSTANFLEILE
jgi:hypothetical protein